jgi:hypothetical protein
MPAVFSQVLVENAMAAPSGHVELAALKIEHAMFRVSSHRTATREFGNSRSRIDLWNRARTIE